MCIQGTIGNGNTGAGLAVGDINGDGHPDIVVVGGQGASYTSLDVFVITVNGDLTFNAPIPLLADADPNAVVLGDFNNDGRLDIASTNFSAGDVTVLIN